MEYTINIFNLVYCLISYILLVSTPTYAPVVRSRRSYYRKRVCFRYDRTSISIGGKMGWSQVISRPTRLFWGFFFKPLNKYTKHAKPSNPPVAAAKLIVRSNLAQTRLRYRSIVSESALVMTGLKYWGKMGWNILIALSTSLNPEATINPFYLPKLTQT
jgi:hypothetical protein